MEDENDEVTDDDVEKEDDYVEDDNVEEMMKRMIVLRRMRWRMTISRKPRSRMMMWMMMMPRGGR